MQPFMMTVNVGQRGEIVIPKKAREALGIEVGTRIQLHVKEGTAEIIPIEDMAAVFERLAKQYGKKIGPIDSDADYDEMMEDQQEYVRRRKPVH